MNAIGEDSRNDLLTFVKGLNKEQADNIIMYCHTQLIALHEAPMLLYLQGPFLRTG
jgi:hypothetical protein